MRRLLVQNAGKTRVAHRQGLLGPWRASPGRGERGENACATCNANAWRLSSSAHVRHVSNVFLIRAERDRVAAAHLRTNARLYRLTI